MGLYNGWKSRCSTWGCNDLNTADGKFILKRTAKAYVVYSVQTGIGLNHMAVGIVPPPQYFANQKSKSLEIVTYKWVYINKDKIDW